MKTGSTPEQRASDVAVDALPVALRQALAGIWQRRATNELRTSSVFASLHRELLAFGAEPSVLSLSARAIDDEARHAALCASVAEHYAGEAVPLPSVGPVESPTFAVCSERVARALFAALQSSINETLAVGFLAECLKKPSSEFTRAALRSLLTDEVRHARIGWAILGSPKLSASDRGVVASFMPALLQVCVGAWLDDDGVPGLDVIPDGHGHLSSDSLHANLKETLTGVILPGLAHVGIDPSEARAWLQTNTACLSSAVRGGDGAK
jgi:hypothetical protein